MSANSRALVAGAGGFIGSHLCEALLEEGWEVRALVRYNGRDDWGHLERFKREPSPRLEVRAGDVRDPYLLRELVDATDAVFHLAALIGIPYSYHAPGSYVETNVVGTLNVLEACKEVGTKRLIVTSTSEVY